MHVFVQRLLPRDVSGHSLQGGDILPDLSPSLSAALVLPLRQIKGDSSRQHDLLAGEVPLRDIGSVPLQPRSG